MMLVYIKKLKCNIFLYIYIITLWKTRKENLRIGILKHMIVNRVVEHLKFIELIPNHKLEKVFEDLSRVNIENLTNL